MQAAWTIRKDSIKAWQKLVDEYRDEDVPKTRRRMNVRREGIVLSQEVIWHRLIGCQVTTQQRSGPDTLVTRFLESSSPLFDLKKVRSAASVAKLAEREMSKFGLRMSVRIGARLQTIFNLLERGEWPTLIGHLESLRKSTTQDKERAVAGYLSDRLAGSNDKRYPGLGHKQARNFIQWLGLSQWEVPLDSRVLKVLRRLGANFVPRGSALTDEAVYLFVQDLVQEVAMQLGILPCELDACIFASEGGKVDGALEED